MKNTRPGTIYTFYSYKGGVGRSMAVANVAALLAKWGHSVLVLDWDLEAPGIEKFFESPPSEVKGRRASTPGVLDLLTTRARGESLDWRDCLLETRPYPQAPPVKIISAGRDDPDYVPSLQGLNWDQLFDEHDLGSYLDDLRQEWADEYDFVLVDSRTGINDIGGICTIILPDVLVLLFTTNEQSAIGARNVGISAREARSRLPTERSRLVVVPLPSRDESRSEYDDAKAWRDRFAIDFAQLFEDWLPRGTTAARVLSKLYIPYWAKWSFGERLPVVEAPEEIEDPAKISAAYAKVASLLSSDLDWGAVEGEGYQARREAEAEAERQRHEEERRRRLRRRWIAAAAVFMVIAVGSLAWWWASGLRERTERDLFDRLASTDPGIVVPAFDRLAEDFSQSPEELMNSLVATDSLRLVVLRRVDRTQLVSRQAFGYSAYLLEDLAARAEWARAPALALRDSLHDAFIATSGVAVPSETQDTLLNRRIRIQGGTFWMGSESGSYDERPVREVTVSTFLIQQHEVTNEEYGQFDPDHRFPTGAERHPVNVSWYDAMAYAVWLGGSLPTEAQWEFAARGERGREYPWGDSIPTCERAQYSGCRDGGTIAVDSLPRGATPDYGLRHLAGNVWEWVADWWGAYDPEDTQDPRGPASGSLRVLRGGSFIFDANFLRGAYRSYNYPENEDGNIGFRVVWARAGGQD